MEADLIRQPAAVLGDAIAAREVSAREVTKAHLDRIAQVDDRVHAFLYVDTDGALAAADAVDAEIAEGGRRSP
ncbi:MAG: Asp-tRNA(Asn)/Glu-tRNA(Gln) amidotransferase GatCAB subunit A, partial [Actinomycetota bacterium]